MVFSPHIARKIAQDSARKLANAEVARQAAKKTSKQGRKGKYLYNPTEKEIKIRKLKLRIKAKEKRLRELERIDKELRATRPIGSLAKVVDLRVRHANSLGYPHGIPTSASDEAFHQRKLMTGIIEDQAVQRKLAAESRVTSFHPGTTAFGKPGGKDPLKDAFLHLQNSPYSPFEQKQIREQYITGKRKGVTFWKKNQFGSTLRNKIEPPKSDSYWRSSDYGGKIGEQSIEEKTAEKLAGLGLGLGGAGILGGGLAYSGDNAKKRPGTPNYGDYFG
jgi:hypothetical protein